MARIVLVADDSPTIQKKALGILKGEGFEVETVSNGVAAIKRLLVIHPVVVLADVSMPGRDGYEVCEFVKKSAELSHVPVLLVASDMEPYDDARGAEVGADGIIKKPFEARELISLVVKFAEQFEASMVPAAEPIAPPVAPAPETAAPIENPDEAPTMVHHVAPDFSSFAEGVAFTEPAGEPAPSYPSEPAGEEPLGYPAGYVMEPAPGYPPEPAVGEPLAYSTGHGVEPPPEYPPEPAVEPAAGYFPEPLPADLGVPYAEPHAEAAINREPVPAPEFVDTIPAPEPQNLLAADTPLTVEESAAPSPLASPSTPPEAPPPSYHEGLEAATPEPVFIEEQPEQASEPPRVESEVRTMIFRAPLEIAEPVWRDETVPAPPAPEPAAPALEPQLEAEAPLAASETPAEQPAESPYNAPSVAATSLDSFTLDDAATGHVHFDSTAAEVASEEIPYSAPAEESPEFAPPGSAPEAAFAENALAESPLEAAFTESVPQDSAPESAFAESPPPEAPQEADFTESASQDSAPEPASPESAVEAAEPPPAYDWPFLYTVVRKVVVRMSPPPPCRWK